MRLDTVHGTTAYTAETCEDLDGWRVMSAEPAILPGYLLLVVESKEPREVRQVYCPRAVFERKFCAVLAYARAAEKERKR